MLYNNPFTIVNSRELTDEERYTIAIALDHEYRGDSASIDYSNIDGKIRDSSTKSRLEKMACYINIYKRVIDTENCQYASKGFRRTFITTKAEKDKLINIYEDLNATLEFMQFERQAGYFGTVLVGLTTYKDKLKFIKLTPNIKSLKVVPDPYFPDEPLEVSYEILANNDIQVKYLWNSTFFEVYHNDKLFSRTKHGYSKVPFAILRYAFDSSTFWGPVDYSAYKFTQARSLLLADSVLRTQTSLFDIMLFTGFSVQEAKQSLHNLLGRGVIIAPEAKKVADSQDTISEPDVRFINPSMISPEKVWELYENLYDHFLHSRGIPKQQFEVSADPSSAEALRISDQYLLQQRLMKRHSLKKFEQDVFSLIKHYANISDKAQLITDFFDPVSFRSVTERVDYYEFMLRNSLITPPQILQQENPDLTEEQATEIFTKNKDFNEPEVPITEENLQRAQAEAAGDAPLGNPLERGEDSSGTYVRWGKSGKKYYYTNDASYASAKKKALAQAKAVLSSGWQE